MVGTPFTANGPLSVPHACFGNGVASLFFKVKGKSGFISLRGAQIFSKSSHMASVTEMLLATVGPPSRLNILETLSSLSLFSSTQCLDPSKPNSSAAHKITKMVRLGLPPAFMIKRAASMAGVIPEPSSTPPVATSNASRWPPIITYSSGYSVPGITPITLWYFTGPILK